MKKILKLAEVFRYGTACRVTDGPGQKDADNSGVSWWDSTWSDFVGKTKRDLTIGFPGI